MYRSPSRRATWCTPLALITAGVLCLGPLNSVAKERDQKAQSAEAATSASAASAGAAPADWLSKAEEEIRLSEYFFSRQDNGKLSAPNRSNDLRSELDASGLRISSRTRGSTISSGGWELRLGLLAYGREGDLQKLESMEPSSSGNRGEIHRGSLSEWYINDDRGLEQGFTLNSPPQKGSSHAPLILEMSLKTDLLAFLSEDGQAVTFKDPSGSPVMQYFGLRAEDSRGLPVEATLSMSTGRLLIRIDDRGAAYPVTVDPTIAATWSVQGPSKTALLGTSVATAGDFNGDGYSDLIIGAPGYDGGQTDEGKVFVYLGSASGPSSPPTPFWSYESNQANAKLGQSVASAGNVNRMSGDPYDDIIVGAPNWPNGATNVGRAFVWNGASSSGGVTQIWTGNPANLVANTYYGFSVSSAGDVNGDGNSDFIVGAYGNGPGGAGRAYLYYGDGSGSNEFGGPPLDGLGGAGAQFGYSVASAGDVNGDGYDDVIIGAPGYDNPSFDHEGAAFIYKGSFSGIQTTPLWTKDTIWSLSRFGSSVATAGDVNGDGYSDVLVGAENFGSPSLEGGVFLFLGAPGTGMHTDPDWSAESGAANGHMGPCATAGDVNGDGYSDIIVGAPGLNSNTGKAFVWYGGPSDPFFGNPSGLGALGGPGNADLTLDPNVSGTSFGSSVATAGDVNGDGFSDLIVGAPLYVTSGNQLNVGKAYLYMGSASGIAPAANWTAEGNQTNAAFRVVATAGDVNGDGFSDVIIGAPLYDNGQTDEGAVFVYHGSPTGLPVPPTANWTKSGGIAGMAFGSSVATAGDVNGDGFSDVIIGAWKYSNGQTEEGSASVYLGSANGLGNTPITREGNQDYAWFGYSVASAGDVNGDGFSDVIIGAPHYSNGPTQVGRAYVYLGNATGIDTSPIWIAQGNQAQAQFGISVASAGDVDGDGFSDVIVGANLYDNGQTDEGAAWVYLGSASGPATSSIWMGEGNVNGAQFGISVGSAGDVNGDGLSDIIVGAPQYFANPSSWGRALVYNGFYVSDTNRGVSNSPSWTYSLTQNAWLGYSVGTAGDVNGDGYSDVIVGAHMYTNGQLNEGEALVFLGSSSGLASSPAWTAESNQASANFGAWVGTAGDVNGDGFSDVIVGAAGYDDPETDEGAAFLYYGNYVNNDSLLTNGAELTHVPVQARFDDSALIGPLGKSDSTSSFRLHGIGRTAAGRGNVRLVYETKQARTVFNGTGLVQGTLTPTGSPGTSGSSASLNELVSGLTSGKAYHWRFRVTSPNPLFPGTPWFSPPFNGRQETDLRTQ